MGDDQKFVFALGNSCNHLCLPVLTFLCSFAEGKESVNMNAILRQKYSDDNYCELAQESI